MKRRDVALHLWLGGCVLANAPWAVAQAREPVGVVILHGKNPGHPGDPSLSALKARLDRLGWLSVVPDMPWSRRRYLDGGWDLAMQDIATQVQQLQAQGAQRIVLIGHSLGCPAALSFAARGGAVDALVLLAPGHIPYGYYNLPALKAVRESIDDARARVAAGQGDETQRFTDINQGRPQVLIASAKNFLSYFDPNSDAEMGVTAPRIPTNLPVFTAIGEKDPLFRAARAYFFDRLPANPRHRYLEVAGGHLDTPREAAEALVSWLQQTALPR